jgi:hypothetical protein
MAKNSAIEEVKVFTDGTGQQFKPTVLSLHFGNFFVTSYGKGAVDGIGETVKRSGLEMATLM